MRRGLVAFAVLVLGVVLAARVWVVDVVSVSSDSMAPTLCTGDLVAVSKLARHQPVGVSDIVTFASPQDGSAMIKRAVAVGGQRVAIKDGVLEVDGKSIVEPYVDQTTIDGVYFGPVTVPDATVFVMGDSREFSIDSRTYGPVPAADIDGRLLGALWSRCDH